MNQEKKLSDEFVNAFVDDELTPEEKAQVYAQLAGNDMLNRQICELRKVRDLIQLAYKEPPIPSTGMATFATGHKFGLGLAAGLALIIGGGAAWFLHETSVAPNVRMAQTALAAPAPAKVLIHVSDGRTDHLKAVLDDVDGLMNFYRQARQKARVEVVANGSGLKLLLSGISPFAKRIRQMQKEYDGLTFVACQNTIDRFHEELGINTKLLPGVVIVDSGVAQIMRRQQQGWAYIQG
jgi:intracellular sulfur oxidation DsrE/DsrF family protein